MPETTSKAKSGAELPYDSKAAIRHLTKVDPTLGRLIKRAGPFGLELLEMHSLFEALARNIIYQQLHGTAASAIHQRVVALGGSAKKLRPQVILQASDGELRGAGLSAAKALALRDLAEKTVDRTLPGLARMRTMDDDEIITRLTAVRGIGRWTVEMLLMFRLGRPDVLPVGDFAVRKGFAVVYGLPESPKPRALAEYGELHWRPFRTIASWYMWRALKL